MIARNGTLQGLTVIVLLVFCFTDCGVSGATTRPIVSGEACSDGDITSDTVGPCPRHYWRCENGTKHYSMCVGGVINNQTGKCVPYTKECSDPGVTARTFTSRSKRQTGVLDNCLRFYECPSDLKRIFVYPDWTNANCDSYIACVNGALLLSSCLRDGYTHYNPVRSSCEDFASNTNICVHRLNTVFGS
uniref:Chitin-binding type-2 domain-containing protein n=1 Tax=Arion vulgaris TaxID=1028688 RepID=A0A0B6ZA24_9EUPU